MKILVTGVAGFIGHHVALALVERGHEVVGLDSINDYYDQELKFARLREAGFSELEIAYGLYVSSSRHSSFRFVMLDITDRESLSGVMRHESFDLVCHLAAQAGVRYSLINPRAYIDVNITGFLNILEECGHGVKSGAGSYERSAGNGNSADVSAGRACPIPLVYASSSSVYGENQKTPFSETDPVESPASLYAVSKRSNELMARAYSRLYGIPSVGLRFFTVYGPWGRPDMSPILFADAISRGENLKVFNNGEMQRDFTYIDDIVEGVVRVVEGLTGKGAKDAVVSDYSSAEGEGTKDTAAPGSPSASPSAGGESRQPIPDAESTPPSHRIYNIGHGSPVHLMDFIREMESALGREARKEYLPMQPGDVSITWADTTALERDFGYCPATDLHTGIARFVEWYRGYYGGSV